MNNICLYALSRKVEIFHELAKSLDENEDLNIGMVVEKTRPTVLFNKNQSNPIEFLKSQNEVDYKFIKEYEAILNQSSKVSDYDIDYYEKKYGDPYLTKLRTSQRYFSSKSHENLNKILYYLFYYFEKLFDENNIDVFIANDLGSFSRMIPFRIGKQVGESLWWHRLRVEDYFGIKKNPYDKFESIEDLFLNFKNKEDSIQGYEESAKKARGYLESFQAENKGAYDDSSSTSGVNFGIPLRAIHYWYQYNFNGYKSSFKTKPTHELIVRQIKQQLRNSYFKRAEFFDEIDHTAEYVYFPLHMQPEWSTLTLSPEFTDQIGLVRQVSRNIPVSATLYVKDHPRMMGRRKKGYYDELKAIENVKLASPHISSNKLILNSIATVTIAGTAGLEAALRSKPSIVVSDPSYSLLSSVDKCENITQLDSMIQSAVNRQDDFRKELIYYLTAVYEKGFEFSYDNYMDYIDDLQEHIVGELQ